MPQQFQPLVGVSRHDRDACITIDFTRQVAQVVVDADGDSVARQALADTGSDVGAGRRRIVLAHRSVG